ncbi:hypothetical protein ABI59_07290 [Acidobacteria bacterium Mor1]|nr:hypothetical protein ABI59_07290 [Acidobacteria bacterium Mor1]
MRYFVSTVCALALSVVLSGDLSAQVTRQWTHVESSRFGPAAIDGSGATIYVSDSADAFGTNPERAWQLVSWDGSTGAGSQLSSFGDGVSPFGRVSVSDDGQKLAFLSASDLTGQNRDQSVEVFLMNSDGTGIVQVTDNPAGSDPIDDAILSGSGNRVLFRSAIDPLGTNPGRGRQMFIIDVDGTNLQQLTSAPSLFLGGGMSISDDGSRIVFHDTNDLTGQNADRSFEIFTVLADGTGLRQLTTDGGTEGHLSGNGSRIAFASEFDYTGGNPDESNQVFLVDWDGSNLTQATLQDSWAELPRLTDDGSVLFYLDTLVDPVENPDGFREVWRVNADGSARSTLTDHSTFYGIDDLAVAGDGSRVVYRQFGADISFGNNPDGGFELVIRDGNGANPRQLTDNPIHPLSIFPPTLSSDGSRLSYVQTYDVVRVDEGQAPVTLVTLTDALADRSSMTGDGQTIVFETQSNILGTNPEQDHILLAVDADGSNLRQVLPEPLSSGGVCGDQTPAVARDGSWMVFQSCHVYTGDFREFGAELYVARLDGSGIQVITDDNDSQFKFPRISGDGSWVVFSNGSGMYRVRNDSTGLQLIDALGSSPDIDGDGSHIVYSSRADPLGTNADENFEIFLFQPPGLITQLTDTTVVANSIPTISEDAAYVYWSSDAPFFGATSGTDLYRLELAGGTIERVGALRRAPSSYKAAFPGGLSLTSDGRAAAFTSAGNWIDDNADHSTEVYVSDFGAVASISVGQASPTLVSWDADPRWRTYDVIRGDVAELQAGAGDTVELGAVTCIEDDSADLDTVGSEDPDDPVPGQVFFYLRRGSPGPAGPVGDYGQGSGSKERLPLSGDCL